MPGAAKPAKTPPSQENGEVTLHSAGMKVPTKTAKQNKKENPLTNKPPHRPAGQGDSGRVVPD